MSLMDKIRDKISLMLNVDRTPHIIALSAAVGMFIGISPYLGVHTYLVLLISGWFNLPLYPMLAAVYVNNPITLAPIYALTTKFGFIILGYSSEIDFDWSNISLSAILSAGKQLFIPFFVGSNIAAILLAFLTYPLVYIMVKLYRNSMKK